ncbi:hypothetical protein FBU30_002394 [Linnemannia zychae]|nr:hypothetical protein FBU30_002394 [Linnemannia zychae]
MGIPIELPSSTPPSTRPCHSAKPSWSNSAQQFQLPPPSSSSHPTNPFPLIPPALSLARQQPQDSRPPLTSLTYNPPPPHSHQALSRSPASFSSSSAYGSYRLPTYSLSSRSNNLDQTTWIHQVRADIASASPLVTGDTLAFTSENQSSSSARLARPHPNLRRISRAPAFSNPHSDSASPRNGSVGTETPLATRSMPSSTTTPSATSVFDTLNSTVTLSTDTSSLSDVDSDEQPYNSSPTTTTAVTLTASELDSQQRPIWHPSSPSLVHYLTRPLPPLPQHPSHTYSLYPSLADAQQQHSYQHDQSQERASWNYRLVNMNHADNHNRSDAIATMNAGRSGMMHGYYYEDDRLRNEQSPITQPYTYRHRTSIDTIPTIGATDVTALSSSTSLFPASRPRQYYSTIRREGARGFGSGMDSEDTEEETWAILQQQHLFERRLRNRPSIAGRERGYQEQERQREYHQDSYHGHHGQMTLSPTEATSSSSSSSSIPSSSSTNPTPLPSFLQGHPAVTRTLIRADAFQQGVIHIYPENHAPIRMYGRPILNSASHNSFPLISSSRPSSTTSRASSISGSIGTDTSLVVDHEPIVHIPARPLAGPPTSTRSSMSATSSSIFPSPAPSIPLPDVSTATLVSMSGPTSLSQDITESALSPLVIMPRTSRRTSATAEAAELGLQASTTPLLTRPPSAALSPVLTSGELYRVPPLPVATSSLVSGNTGSSTLMSPMVLRRPPSAIQAPRSQSVALSTTLEGEATDLSIEETHFCIEEDKNDDPLLISNDLN